MHVKKFRLENPHLSYKECLKQAKLTYTPSKKGGNILRDTQRAFENFGKKLTRGFNRVSEKTNPLNDKKFQRVGHKIGQVTNDELLPIVQQIGTEAYKRTSQMIDPFTFGMTSKAANVLFNKMAKKYIRKPKSQISQAVADVGSTAVQLYKPTK